MRIREITEATMSTTIQGRHPVSAGARGLMAARWKYDTIVRGSDSKNMINAVERLASTLDGAERTDYDGIDSMMQQICREFEVDPKDLHNAFIAKYRMIPDDYAKKLKKDRANRPKSV